MRSSSQIQQEGGWLPHNSHLCEVGTFCLYSCCGSFQGPQLGGSIDTFSLQAACLQSLKSQLTGTEFLASYLWICGIVSSKNSSSSSGEQPRGLARTVILEASEVSVIKNPYSVVPCLSLRILLNYPCIQSCRIAPFNLSVVLTWLQNSELQLRVFPNLPFWLTLRSLISLIPTSLLRPFQPLFSLSPFTCVLLPPLPQGCPFLVPSFQFPGSQNSRVNELN